MSGRSRRIRSSISLARSWASSRRWVPSSAEREEGHQPMRRVEKAELARLGLPVASANDAPDEGRPLGLDLARLASPRRAARGESARRRSPVLQRRSPPRAARRSRAPRSTRGRPAASRAGRAPFCPSTSTSARLCTSRTRGTARAAACTRSRSVESSIGSTCTTTSACGSARSTAASTASAAAWPWPTAAPGRDPDHDVGELTAARLAHADPPHLDRGLQFADRSECRCLGLSGRPIHQHVDIRP